MSRGVAPVYTADNLPPVGTIGVTPTHGKGIAEFVGAGIRWFTATREQYNGGKSHWVNAPVNHAVVMVGPVPGVDGGYPQLIQAANSGAQFARWDTYGTNMIWLDAIRQQLPHMEEGAFLVPSPAQQSIIRAEAVQLVANHTGYNPWDYLAIALAQKRFGNHEEWLAHEWWVRRLNYGVGKLELICSQLCDYLWHKAGLDIFADMRPDGLVSPEDLYLAGGAPIPPIAHVQA